MDNYLLMGHILVCKVIPKDKIHPELWVGANRKWRKVPHDRIVRVKHNRVCMILGQFWILVYLNSSILGTDRGRATPCSGTSSTEAASKTAEAECRRD